ncbi:MAG TPA: MlaD family protein [Rhodopila sp.]
MKSIISGPYIGVEPHPGHKQDHYQGLEERPVNANDPQGTHYILLASKLGNVARGSILYYRDLQVGEVEDARLEDDQRQFRIDLFVHAPFDRLVHDDTRFWNAGAAEVSMASSGPKLQMQSVPALFEGALGFETPDDAPGGAVAKSDKTFSLYETRDAALHAPDNRAVQYRVVFHAQEAGGLEPGASVTLQDKRVGSVTRSTLQYDAADGQLNTVATLAIEPADIELAGNGSWGAEAKPQMDTLLHRLVEQGLRARPGSTIPLVGGKGVQLAFVPGAPPVSLGSGPIPDIPTGPASDIGGTMAAVNSVATKINAMPLDQIASEIHDATQRIAALSSSPQVAQSLLRLERSLANIEDVTRDTKVQAAPLLAELRRTASEAQSTLTAARGLVGNNLLAQTQPDTSGLGNTLYELNRAARSLRELADYLSRHPEALLRGKGEPG